MKSTIFVILVMAAFLTACSPDESGTLIHIEGNFRGGDIAFVSRIEGDSILRVDTLDVNQVTVNDFIRGTDKPDFYIIDFPGGTSLRFAARGGDHLVFDVDATGDYLKYTVEGNTASQALHAQYQLILSSMAMVDSLDETNLLYTDSANIAEVRQSLNATFHRNMVEHREKLREMILADTTALTNIFAFYQSVAQMSVLEPQKDMDLFLAVDNGLQSAHGDHPLARSFHKSVTNLRAALERSRRAEAARSKVREGTLAPEINLEDPMGTPRKLSDLRGNYVLIDFWAAWCGPCRINNPHLVEMYKKYKDRGFEIYSVSLDGLPKQSLPREDWKAAIQQDQLTWPNHVSDLLGWNSEVVTTYGVQSIPYTLLLNPKGHIVAQNLRGDALERKLEELL